MRPFCVLLLFVFVAPLPEAAPALAASEDLRLAGADDYLLDVRVDVPSGAEFDTVVVLVHGSGPAGIDHDLTAVTAGKEKNLFFKEIADALLAEGLAVFRYNKRTYQFGVDANKDEAFKKSGRIKAFEKAPLSTLIADTNAMVAHARERFPDARVVVLGASQGTYVALQSAYARGNIDALVLIGFYAESLDTLVHQQTVLRPLHIFDDLDANGDGVLDESEMKKGGQLGASLLFQRPVLDLDDDDRYTRSEFMAGNFSNLILRDFLGSAYRREEAALPRVARILGELEIPVLFFQGDWDNQTPAYHARAVEVANRMIWGRQNLRFHFYPERGHILDPRDSFEDLVYRRADPAILAEIASAVAGLWESADEDESREGQEEPEPAEPGP